MQHHLAAILAIGVAACASDQPVTTFVGPTSNPSVFVALSTDGTSTTAYLCDGDLSVASPTTEPGVSAWLSTDDGSLDLSSTDVALHAELDVATARGSVNLVGENLTFELAAAAGSDAGFFAADQIVNGSRVLGGWIVLADGQQRGSVGFDGGGGIGQVEIGPLLAPRSSAITIAGIGKLRVFTFNPRGFDGGGGIGHLPTMGMGM